MDAQSLLLVVLGLFLLVMAGIILVGNKDADGDSSVRKMSAILMGALGLGLCIYAFFFQGDTATASSADVTEGRSMEDDEWFSQLSSDSSVAKAQAQEVYMKGFALWNGQAGGYDSAETALAYFQESIDIYPMAEALNASGQVKVQLGMVNEAGADYDQAIELNPEYGQAYFNRGTLYFIVNDQAHACLDWEKADELGVPQASQALTIYCGGN